MAPVIGRTFATSTVKPDLAEAIVNGDVELIGIDDIAKRLGVSRSTLERWIRTGNGSGLPTFGGQQTLGDLAANLTEGKMSFPPPDIYIGSSPKWDKKTVVAWLVKNSGKPPASR